MNDRASNRSIRFLAIGDETYSIIGSHSDQIAGTSVYVERTATKVTDLELQFSGSVTVTDPSRNDGATDYVDI